MPLLVNLGTKRGPKPYQKRTLALTKALDENYYLLLSSARLAASGTAWAMEIKELTNSM
jgi:hypothetical protein